MSSLLRRNLGGGVALVDIIHEALRLQGVTIKRTRDCKPYFMPLIENNRDGLLPREDYYR